MLISMSRPERRAMVVRDHPALSLSRRCRLLSIGRSSLYKPKGESAEMRGSRMALHGVQGCIGRTVPPRRLSDEAFRIPAFGTEEQC